MPSTHSTSVPRLLPSSTVMTPSLPTFSIASASILPISESPFEATVPTWAISEVLLILIDIFLSSAPSPRTATPRSRSEEHTSELQSQFHLVCRLLLEKKKKQIYELPR